MMTDKAGYLKRPFWLLLSFGGRLRRLEFVVSLVIWLVFWILASSLTTLMYPLEDMFEGGAEPPYWLIGSMNLLLFYSLGAVTMKRINDLGWRKWWAIGLYWPLLYLIAGYAWVTMPSSMVWQTYVLGFIAVIGQIALYAYIGMLLFKPGQDIQAGKIKGT